MVILFYFKQFSHSFFLFFFIIRILISLNTTSLIEIRTKRNKAKHT